ncbi:hypothetical protein B0H13DRAFT_1864368 [Mycena leptocephala]|nr:hypothetical protein B0H13DRAFT_1864368 [Mycena leptocephala]
MRISAVSILLLVSLTAHIGHCQNQLWDQCNGQNWPSVGAHSQRATIQFFNLTGNGIGGSVTSLPSAPTTPRNQIPTRVIAGISISVASIVIGLAIALILRARCRRRGAKLGASEINRQANTISPFTLNTQIGGNVDTAAPGDSDVRSISASTIARQRLETELLAMHEKMIDLQALERRTSAVATDSSESRRILRPMWMRGTSTRRSPDLEAQLQAAREHIDMLMARINALEADAECPFQAGISDGPPPAYV